MENIVAMPNKRDEEAYKLYEDIIEMVLGSEVDHFTIVGILTQVQMDLNEMVKS